MNTENFTIPDNDRIHIAAYDENGEQITQLAVVTKYYDNRRFDVLAKAIEKFIKEIQAKNKKVAKVKIKENQSNPQFIDIPQIFSK